MKKKNPHMPLGQESTDTAVRTIGSLAKDGNVKLCHGCAFHMLPHKWTAGRSSGEPFVSIAPRGKSIAKLFTL